MKKLIAFLSIFIIFVSYGIYNEMYFYEYFKAVSKINSSENQKCKLYPYENPIETFIPLTEEIFVGGSTDYGKRFLNFKYLEHDYEKGSLAIFNKTSGKIFKAQIENFPKNVPISPDGLDFYNGKLYVINHAYLEGERIEVINMSIKPLKLTYEKTFKFDKDYFGKFNSIAVINEDIFYVTSWLANALPLDKNISKFKMFLYKYYDIIKRVLNLKFTYLYKFNMRNNTLEKINGSNGIGNNGIAFDKNNKLLFMAQTFERNIKVYQIDDMGDIKNFEKDLYTGYALDNLYFDNKKNILYAAIIGKISDNFNFLNPKNGISRKQVYGGILAYDLKKGDQPMYTFLQNDFICQVTHGMIINNYIYLSSFYDSGILECEILN